MTELDDALLRMQKSLPEIVCAPEDSAHLANAIAFLGEPPLGVIPNVALGRDGAYLHSLIVATNHYLCEVHLRMSPREFDFTNRLAVANYRVSRGEVSLGEGESIAVYQTAQVVLMHPWPGVATEMNYYGSSPTEWLALVRELFPPLTALPPAPHH